MNNAYASLDDIAAWARARMQRTPDFVIGDPDQPYLRRWWQIPRNEFSNVYLHEILQSDAARELHDHPWPNSSFVVSGGFLEVMPLNPLEPWGETFEVWRGPGSIVNRKATDAHRLTIPDGKPCVSIFSSGAKERNWGFWCPDRRFIPWREFTSGEHGELPGKGCGE